MIQREFLLVPSAMRRFALLLLLASCGDDDDAAVVDPIDAAPGIDAMQVPDAAGACDPEAQAGCGAGQKCTFVAVGEDFDVACLPDGTVANDLTCTRDPVLGHGHDDCAAGGFCTFIGVLPPDDGGERFCRAICSNDADCDDSQRCAEVGAGFGMCGPSCAPFSACADGMTCGEVWASLDEHYFLVCRPHTGATDGAACAADADCGENQVCFDGLCHSMCDETHTCTTGSCNLAIGDAHLCS